MALQVKTPKHPEAVETYYHNWVNALLVEGEDVGDTVLPGTSIVEILIGDMVLDGDTVTGTNTIYTLSGGTEDTWIRVSIDTANGRTLVDDILVKIATTP